MSTLFTRETMLDIVVNLVPLGIIAFFSILFLVFAPWGYDLYPILLMTGLHVVPFVFLSHAPGDRGWKLSGLHAGFVFPAPRTYLTFRAIAG